MQGRPWGFKDNFSMLYLHSPRWLKLHPDPGSETWGQEIPLTIAGVARGCNLLALSLLTTSNACRLWPCLWHGQDPRNDLLTDLFTMPLKLTHHLKWNSATTTWEACIRAFIVAQAPHEGQGLSPLLYQLVQFSFPIPFKGLLGKKEINLSNQQSIV